VKDQTTGSSGVFATDRLEQIIDAYVADYELVGEDESGRDGCYAPTDTERGLIKDAIIGLLADTDWDAEWGKLIALRASESADTERPQQDKAVPASLSPDTRNYIASLVAERDELRQALNDAATSLETLASLSGRKNYGAPPIATYMDTFMDVRLYAAARAKVARSALSAKEPT
jgi:hypothetical protein